jgi:hypothetical protein
MCFMANWKFGEIMISSFGGFLAPMIDRMRDVWLLRIVWQSGASAQAGAKARREAIIQNGEKANLFSIFE